MIKALYDGAAAMHVIHSQHEQIANNLANMNTGGFHRVILGVRNTTGTANGNTIGSGPEIDGRQIDFSHGRQIVSKRALDVAVSGDGFFKLRAEDGSELFTTNGRFFRNHSTSQLVSDGQLPVLGTSGPITIPENIPDNLISIGSDGSIVADGNVLGKIAVVAFEDNNTLLPVGQTIFRAGADTVEKPADVQVRQYFHEISNINPTHELINLIVGSRHYEAIQKTIRSVSESLQQSIRQ